MISICIATYNGERFIKEQLDSILPQLSEEDEVIISDDSSTDRTVEIINSFHSKQITLLEGGLFHSPTFNFEHALKHTNHEVIFLSDQDDIWEKDKVQKMLQHLQTYDLVISDATIIDANGDPTGDTFYNINNSVPGLINNLIKNSYIGCTMAFNRKVLVKVLPFPKSTPMHDWWIGLVAECFGKVYFMQEPLTLYRRHETNASASAEKSPYSLGKKLSMRFTLLANLFLRGLRK